jgi:tetratricopeptide (TPR) repeat protein
MPTQKRFLDPAWECFQPLESLQFNELAPLMCRCLGLWEYWTHPDRLGPMMMCSDLNRAILIDSGLPISHQLNQEAIITNPPLLKVLGQFQKDQDNSISGVKMVRLLLAMGCHSQAQEFFYQIRPSSNPRLGIWFSYIKWMLENSKKSQKGNEETLWTTLQNIEPPYGPEAVLLGFIVFRNCRTHYFEIKQFLIRAIGSSLLDGWERFLALSKLYRIDSELHEISGNSERAIELRDFAFLSADKGEKAVTTDWQKHLCLETKRRLFEYAYRLAIRQKKDAEAKRFSEHMIALDPLCARAHLLAGEVCLKLNLKRESAEHLQRSSVLGILEKPYANYLLAKCHSKNLNEYYLSKSVHSAFFRKDISHVDQAQTFPSSMEIADLQSNSHLNHRGLDFKQRCQTDKILNCFSPYCLSEHIGNQARPMCAQLPEIAWKAFKTCSDPYFATQGLQRALVIGFRKELLHSSNGWRWVSEEQFTRFSNWIVAMGDTDKIALSANIAQGKPLEKAYYSRYLAIMGFFNEALEFIKPFAMSNNWSIEEQFLSTVFLWIKHFFVTADCGDFLLELHTHYEKLSKCPETLRMRSTISILGTVISAKTQRYVDCEFWRGRALETLDLIQKCPLFAQRDKVLLESRIYRAISYVPFIMGNRDLLLQEQEHFLKLAYDLSNYFTEEKTIIYRDNVFAALESSARIFEKLGRLDEALTHMEEIAKKVDPLDSKAWLQVGELYRKLNRIPEALDSFLKAAMIGAPHAQISYYSAGRCAEQLNDLNLAKDLFLQSALALPGGISPLLRLSKLCHTLNDQQLKSWALQNLDRVIPSSSESNQLRV